MIMYLFSWDFIIVPDGITVNMKAAWEFYLLSFSPDIPTATGITPGAFSCGSQLLSVKGDGAIIALTGRDGRRQAAGK